VKCLSRIGAQTASKIHVCALSGRATEQSEVLDLATDGSCAIDGARYEVIRVAVIDGPYDVATLSGILASPPLSLSNGSCRVDGTGVCNHGTFIMGLLGARKNALIPGLCPDCRLLHVPLFTDPHSRSASVDDLANAIGLAVAAGARLINLSLAIIGDQYQCHPGLATALDEAEKNGVVVVAAVGNCSRRSLGQLLSHPVTIPVAAVDASGRLLADCNFGPTMSRRGVSALGQWVGYAPGGGTAVLSGSSVAAAVATGILAQVWSMRPEVVGADIRTAVARLTPRDRAMPPILDRDTCLSALAGANRTMVAASLLARIHASNHVRLQGETTMVSRNEQPIHLARTAPGSSISEPVVRPALGGDGCACGAPTGICTCDNIGSSPSRFIYVIGTVDIRFPDQSISEELQAVARMAAQTTNDDTLNTAGEDEPLRAWYHRVLSRPEARYVARQVCWILKVEGQPAYYLTLRDLHDLATLIECLAHADNEDFDLFVGSSTLIPTDACPGIFAPPLLVEQMRPVDRESIRQWCEVPEPRSRAKRPSSNESSATAPDPDRLFNMLVQSADNLGDRDEWRALNYLAISCKPLYEKYVEMAIGGHDLDAIRVLPSRLSREKRIVDTVFAFRERRTGVVQKFFARVDVTHLFPVMVNGFTEYFDR
jgi:hypothetical protein